MLTTLELLSPEQEALLNSRYTYPSAYSAMSNRWLQLNVPKLKPQSPKPALPTVVTFLVEGNSILG